MEDKDLIKFWVKKSAIETKNEDQALLVSLTVSIAIYSINLHLSDIKLKTYEYKYSL